MSGEVTSVRKMFVDRMRREGRGEEWDLAIRDCTKQMGGVARAIAPAMDRMGYEGPKEERARYAAWLEQQALENKIEDFDEAVRTLPDKAAQGVELDWIRAHPAMTRMDRNPDKTKQVLVTADDILEAPHGKAPSKAAAYQLQHFANRPGEFFKQLLSEHKKKSDSGAEAGSQADMGLEEVMRLLKEIQVAKGK